MIETTLVVLLMLGIYSYLIYPILVWLLARLTGRSCHEAGPDLTVTVVIAAFNEEAHIEATVRNKLEQDYPKQLLDVVIVSDGSTDATDVIVSRLATESSRVRLLTQGRRGKTAGLNLALQHIEADIVVFSDANSIFAADAVQNLVDAFGDSSVGYVSGKMEYQTEADSIAGGGSSAYMRYENLLRTWESKIGSIIGVDGGIDAVRRGLYQPMKDNELPDFSLPLRVVEQGYRVVYQPDAIVFEDALKSTSDELRMRVRVSARAMWTLLDFARLLNPFSFGLFSWQLFSHKWMRYLSFLPLVLAYMIALTTFQTHVFSQIVFLAMTVCGIAALLGVREVSRLSHLKVVKLCAYFGLLNFAAMIAFFQVLRGKRITTWQPRVG